MLNRIYLDNNATTFLDQQVKEKLHFLLEKPLGNPSSIHALGQVSKGLLVEARRTIASYFQATTLNQIIFTSSGTEGAYLSIKGLLKDKPPKHIIASNIEHPCVNQLLESFQKQGVKITFLPVGLEGAIHIQDLKKALEVPADLITIMGANNETGVKNDLTAIAKIALEHQVPLVVDGVALLGKDKVTLPKGISAMFFSGHKIHALPGCGFIYLAPSTKLKPMISGTQEFGLRGGTENLLGIISLAEALKVFFSQEAEILNKIKGLRDHLEQSLLSIPGISVNGSGERVSNTTNLYFEGLDGETFLIALDQAGVAVSLGSACSSGAIEPSKVLLNMGFSRQRAEASLRMSLSRFNTLEEINQAIVIISSLYQKKRKMV